MEKLLLKPAEVAEALSIGRSAAYELLASGELPSVRVGRSVRVPADALVRWVKDRDQARPESQAPSQGD